MQNKNLYNDAERLKEVQINMKRNANKTLNLAALLAAALLAVVMHVELASAAAIGASPAQVSFSGVLSGGYAESDVAVSTNTNEVVFGHFEVEGAISSWVSFLPNTSLFNVTLNSPRTTTVIVQPPADMPVGTYTGRLTIVSDSVAGIAGRAGSVIKSAVILPLTVTVTGTQTVGCTSGAFEFEDVEEGLPLVMWATVKNTGNVRLSPLIALSVWDSLQERVVLKQELRGKETLPTRTERFFATLDNDLAVGQYWVDFSMPECESKALLTFTVIEKGGIADKGELTELSTPGKVTVGEPVPITALFYNKGTRVVTAQFKGAVKKDKKVVAAIESEEIAVESGKVEKLVAYFVPKEPGTYTITGRVIYNRKLTFEKNANFVTEKGERKQLPAYLSPLIIYAILIITALFLIRKIRERKRKHRSHRIF